MRSMPQSFKAIRLPVLLLVGLLCGTVSFADSIEIAPAPPAASGMTLGQSLFLGVVEGFTEYLPVSSTGHLIVLQRLMGIGVHPDEKDAADAYAIVIQAGAIFAVIGLYFGFFKRMLLGFLGKDPEGLRLATNLMLAFLPAAFLGLTAHRVIKDALFGVKPVAVAWFVGGVAILAVSRWKSEHRDWGGEELMDLRWSGALIIGLMQCIAVWPGTSRSLVTILGGILVGLSLRSAVIFSFLLGAITLCASTAYDSLKHGEVMIEAFGWPPLLVGFGAAFVSAAFAVRWLINYLKRHGLSLFGYYRIAIALVTAALIAAGVLDPN